MKITRMPPTGTIITSLPATKIFGTPYPDLVAAMQQGGPIGRSRGAPEELRRRQQIRHAARPDDPHRPRRYRPCLQGHGQERRRRPLQHQLPLDDDRHPASSSISEPPSRSACGAVTKTDGETIRACMQIYEPLMRYKYGTTETEPALANSYDANADLTEYTFHLRHGVKWSDGSALHRRGCLRHLHRHVGLQEPQPQRQHRYLRVLEWPVWRVLERSSRPSKPRSRFI